MMKILLTGANGYIGKRLLPVLVNRGYEIYSLVRDAKSYEVVKSLKDKVTTFQVDFFNSKDFRNLPQEIDAAYYLIHSFTTTADEFLKFETKTLHNFVEYVSQTSAQQIIYLGCISDDVKYAGHVSSNMYMENILKRSNIPLTILRATTIIGSGSRSFEIIRDIIEKIPIIIAPNWVNTNCQPVSIRNVIYYLEKVLLKDVFYNKTFDIAGPEILTYKQMLSQFAELRKIKRIIITLPFNLHYLYQLIINLITPIPSKLAKSLVESMKNEITSQYQGIDYYIPQELLTYRESVKVAFAKIEQNIVDSSWKDSRVSGVLDQNVTNFIEVPKYGCLKDSRKENFSRNVQEVLNNIWSIGGDRGWYFCNLLWKIRGYIDKMVGGVGLRRGRRSPTELKTGDALDFWRVILADKISKRLFLYAEMKLPGEAWLEFQIVENERSQALVQTATFRPKGIWGRLYWYALLPIHITIFKGMIKNIIKFSP